MRASRGPPMLVSLALPVLLARAYAQDIPFERYELPRNRLQVVLMEDHSLPAVVVDIWYRVGSKDELPGGAALPTSSST